MGISRQIKVFISYSHDSQNHQNRVLALANRLRQDGIDCWLDQFEVAPPRGWLLWMEEQIKSANFVLLVCTSEYRIRIENEPADATGRGVRWEAQLIYQSLYEAHLYNQKFIAVLPDDGSIEDIPTILRPYTNFRFESGYDALYCYLTNQLTVPVPPLGPLHFYPSLPARSKGLPPNLSVAELLPKFAAWLAALDTLIARNQISHSRREEVLRSAISPSLDGKLESNKLLEQLVADTVLRRSINLKIPEELSQTRLVNATSVRAHQVVSAISLGLDVVVTLKGIRFVLVPPGTASNGSINVQPFYMAQMPVTEAQWATITGAGPTDPNKVRVEISLQDAQRFLSQINQQLSNHPPLQTPTTNQWQFALACNGTKQLSTETSDLPSLDSQTPSALGLIGLLGLVWQFSRNHAGWHELCGGGYRTPREQLLGEPLVIPCRSTVSKSREWSVRPVFGALY
jgi:hypothetical protein